MRRERGEMHEERGKGAGLGNERVLNFFAKEREKRSIKGLLSYMPMYSAKYIHSRKDTLSIKKGSLFEKLKISVY